MKKRIAFIFLIFIITSLCSGYTVKELYRKLNNYDNRKLYLYEGYDNESNELIFYELETTEIAKGVRTIYRLRSHNLEKLKKFVIYLQRNYDNKKYSEAILDYKRANTDLIFLWDNVDLDQNINTETFCYELK